MGVQRNGMGGMESYDDKFTVFKSPFLHHFFQFLHDPMIHSLDLLKSMRGVGLQSRFACRMDRAALRALG